MRVLVTGASGFIGGALASALEAAGHTVRGLGRGPGAVKDWHRADLGVPGSLAGACEDCEAVVHLAGVAHTRAAPHEHQAVTVEGTRALVAEARRAGVGRFVFVSSIKVECAHDAYAKSRAMAEGLVQACGLPSVVIVRPALVYGAGMRGNLERLLKAADLPWPLPIPRAGARRSLVHRDDLVRVLVALVAVRGGGAVYTVTDGTSYTLRDIYDVMRDALGRSPGRTALPAGLLAAVGRFGDHVARWVGRCPWDTRSLAPLLESCVSDDGRVWGDLGMAPRYTLASGVADMVAARTGHKVYP
ncbi:NAD-dependent epimerase/dehydratase family protein [Acidiferrobacter sp.]|uniref:NAD-dependent epimerase/dehydratase family protein n=1 Tax=Acidiferrobacter sp. TaxID=1872107 RepID=UPI0026288F96|nr:NAD-dependent epimerase/dehydratase family protein [Acidiferrobacter sp.]